MGYGFIHFAIFMLPILDFSFCCLRSVYYDILGKRFLSVCQIQMKPVMYNVFHFYTRNSMCGKTVIIHEASKANATQPAKVPKSQIPT
jgi:hypothetical protein